MLKTAVLSTTPCSASVPGPFPNATTSSTVTNADFVKTAAGSGCSDCDCLLGFSSCLPGIFAAPYDLSPFGPVAQVNQGCPAELKPNRAIPLSLRKGNPFRLNPPTAP